MIAENQPVIRWHVDHGEKMLLRESNRRKGNALSLEMVKRTAAMEVDMASGSRRPWTSRAAPAVWKCSAFGLHLSAFFFRFFSFKWKIWSQLRVTGKMEIDIYLGQPSSLNGQNGDRHVSRATFITLSCYLIFCSRYFTRVREFFFPLMNNGLMSFAPRIGQEIASGLRVTEVITCVRSGPVRRIFF